MQSGKLARVSILRQFKNCTFPSVVVSTYLLGFVGHRKMLFIKFNDWPFPVPSLPFTLTAVLIYNTSRYQSPKYENGF